MFQDTTAHCNITTQHSKLNHTTEYYNTQHTTTHYSTLQHTIKHYNTLQHTKTCYNTIQHTTTYNNTRFMAPGLAIYTEPNYVIPSISPRLTDLKVLNKSVSTSQKTHKSPLQQLLIVCIIKHLYGKNEESK